MGHQVEVVARVGTIEQHFAIKVDFAVRVVDGQRAGVVVVVDIDIGLNIVITITLEVDVVHVTLYLSHNDIVGRDGAVDIHVGSERAQQVVLIKNCA